MEWLTALSFGLLGSFHCIGMCGPIAFALPVPKNRPVEKALGILVYNLGRVTLYSLAGLTFGVIGQGFSAAGLQQALSVTVGLLILTGVFFPVIVRRFLPATHRLYGLSGTLKQHFRESFKRNGFPALFFIGLLNGLLPCGLVYLAIAGSLLTGDAIGGGLYMMMFGLGTMPMMAAVSFGANRISLSFRNRIRKLMPVVLLLFGLLFIVRGLNLDIPYLSPKLDVELDDMKACH